MWAHSVIALTKWVAPLGQVQIETDKAKKGPIFYPVPNTNEQNQTQFETKIRRAVGDALKISLTDLVSSGRVWPAFQCDLGGEGTEIRALGCFPVDKWAK
jgi:hypothetical protein